MSTEKKGGIPASFEKVESGRVPEMWDPGEYREGNIRVSDELKSHLFLVHFYV